MGKITLNGKDRTTPFTWNGKQIVKFTIGGKVCTLQAAAGSGCSIEHSYPNGFGYSGTYPSHFKNVFDVEWGGTPANQVPSRTQFEVPGGQITSLVIPWRMTDISVQRLNELECLTLTEAIGSNGPRTSIAHLPKLKTLIAPKIRYLYTLRDCPSLTSLDLPSLIIAIDNLTFDSPNIKSINLPSVTEIRPSAFSRLKGITLLNLPKLETINSNFKEIDLANVSSTFVTLPSKFNTTAEKDRIFGPGGWNNVTFHWV